MNVVVFASRKGGSGKSTLAAHLGSYKANTGDGVLLFKSRPSGGFEWVEEQKAA